MDSKMKEIFQKACVYTWDKKLDSKKELNPEDPKSKEILKTKQIEKSYIKEEKKYKEKKFQDQDTEFLYWDHASPTQWLKKINK